MHGLLQCYAAVDVARVYVKMAACYATGLSADEKCKLEQRVGESPSVE